jgi:hypothetical protein
MGNAAGWAGTAGNKFRQAARESTNPTTTLLAEGLTALAEAIRDLDQELSVHFGRAGCSSPGANVLAVSRMLGHENPQVTLRVYAELFDTDLDTVSDALDVARRTSVAERGPRRVVSPRHALLRDGDPQDARDMAERDKYRWLPQ